MSNKRNPSEIMLRVKSALHYSSPDESLEQIVNRDPEAFSQIRMLYATDAGTPIEAPIPTDPEIAVTGIFSKSRFLVYSKAAHRAMKKGGYRYKIKCRTLLDVNFLSELPSYYDGQQKKQTETIAKTLAHIDTQIGRGIDWTFSGFENAREVLRGGNPFPYRKVAAIKYFDRSGSIAPLDNGFSNEDPSLNVYFRDAEKFWTTMITTRATWDILATRDLIYCVLLKSMLERWAGVSIADGLRNLVAFCVGELDIVPLKELYFAWKLFQPNSDLAILNEDEFKSPMAGTLGRISALAWDLFLFRWLETNLTDRIGSDFYFPLVTSLDADLVAAIKACPLRAVIIHDNGRLVESIFEDTRDFNELVDRVITGSLRERVMDPSRQVGRRARQPISLASAIYRLEKEIEKRVPK